MNDLLQTLPSLRCLDLYCVFLQGAVLNSTTPRVIEKLRFKDSENEYDPVGQCASIVTLVALFTEIGELDIDVGDATWVEEETEDLWFVEKYVDVVTANGTVGHTRIRELRCGGKAISRIFVPLYLLKIGALENLTHLTVHLLFDAKSTEFFKLVLAASSTLTTMCIEFGDFTGFGTSSEIESCILEVGTHHRYVLFLDLSFDLFPDTSPTQDVAGMEHALSKCTLLEDIKIVTPLLFCRWYDEHRTDWLSPIRTLTFIPTNQLRRVTLDIQGTSDNAHDLAWDQLRNWLSGLTHLEEVNIELKQAFDQRICLASEMGQYRSVFTPRYVLPNGDTIVDSPVFRCVPSCPYIRVLRQSSSISIRAERLNQWELDTWVIRQVLLYTSEHCLIVFE